MTQNEVLWGKGWREKVITKINQPWDVIIIGGGITGAGILREATRLGLASLLIDQRDFAWGTSSRSSKLVHGGLRYLKDGRILLTRDSVLEREKLLQECPGLVDPLGFLLTIYKGDDPGRWTLELGLSIYDLLAMNWGHHYFDANELLVFAPRIDQEALVGGFRYGDAQTDDARLVLRLITEAVMDGGTAINYVKAESVIKVENNVSGVRIHDHETGSRFEVYAKVVINATGVWADNLRRGVSGNPRIRPLRGSHLIFPSWRLPVAQAVSFYHPSDRRPVFIFPWEGATILGTTDLDHDQHLDIEPSISPVEVSYLMAAIDALFPHLNITLDDVISTISGIRPVIDTGKKDPSQESRDHIILHEDGLFTVTGGKLTTFRLIALDVLKVVRNHFPEFQEPYAEFPILNQSEIDSKSLRNLSSDIRRRILGRYGNLASKIVEIAEANELDRIPGTNTLWAELRWAARAEGVCHLDDLLLRRVRLGLLLPSGGETIMSKIRAICQPELGWDDQRWEAEETAYVALWKKSYGLPDIATIPDWKRTIDVTRSRRKTRRSVLRYYLNPPRMVSGVLLMLAWFLVFLLWRRRKRQISNQG